MAAGKASVTPEQALKNLKDGNQRFIQGNCQDARKSAQRRAEVARGQKPVAVIVGCSDSRVPPELIFDQGLGDIFIIRLAGNIVDGAALGSIEYAVDHLGTPLVVVLGHQDCGAIKATVQGGEAHGHITILVETLKPAVEKAKGQPGDLLDNAIRANVQLITEQLKSADPIMSAAVKAGKVKIVGAHYNMNTGVVSFAP